MVSVRRVAPILLLAVTIPAFGAKPTATPKSTSHPPRELHKVGDHWTPYNPPDPASYPPNAKTYTIKPGDTLWGLATQFYKNGYLWPQLWESNTWITDAHWIYPGDVLLLEGEAAANLVQTETGTGTTAGQPTVGGGGPGGTTAATGENPLGAPPEIRMVTAADAVGGSASPIPLGNEYDVYCYGYIGDPNEPLPNRLQSYEDVETRYEPGAYRQSLSGGLVDRWLDRDVVRRRRREGRDRRRVLAGIVGEDGRSRPVLAEKRRRPVRYGLRVVSLSRAAQSA